MSTRTSTTDDSAFVQFVAETKRRLSLIENGAGRGAGSSFGLPFSIGKWEFYENGLQLCVRNVETGVVECFDGGSSMSTSTTGNDGDPGGDGSGSSTGGRAGNLTGVSITQGATVFASASGDHPVYARYDVAAGIGHLEVSVVATHAGTSGEPVSVLVAGPTAISPRNAVYGAPPIEMTTGAYLVRSAGVQVSSGTCTLSGLGGTIHIGFNDPVAGGDPGDPGTLVIAEGMEILFSVDYEVLDSVEEDNNGGPGPGLTGTVTFVAVAVASTAWMVASEATSGDSFWSVADVVVAPGGFHQEVDLHRGTSLVSSSDAAIHRTITVVRLKAGAPSIASFNGTPETIGDAGNNAIGDLILSSLDEMGLAFFGIYNGDLPDADEAALNAWVSDFYPDDEATIANQGTPLSDPTADINWLAAYWAENITGDDGDPVTTWTDDAGSLDLGPVSGVAAPDLARYTTGPGVKWYDRIDPLVLPADMTLYGGASLVTPGDSWAPDGEYVHLTPGESVVWTIVSPSPGGFIPNTVIVYRMDGTNPGGSGHISFRMRGSPTGDNPPATTYTFVSMPSTGGSWVTAVTNAFNGQSHAGATIQLELNAGVTEGITYMDVAMVLTPGGFLTGVPYERSYVHGPDQIAGVAQYGLAWAADADPGSSPGGGGGGGTGGAGLRAFFSSYYSPGIATFYVDSASGDDGNDGRIDTPFTSIQHAIDTATSGGRIIVNAGEYGPIFINDDYTGGALQIMAAEGAMPIIRSGTDALTSPPLPDQEDVDGNNRAVLIRDSKYVGIYGLEIQGYDVSGFEFADCVAIQGDTSRILVMCNLLHDGTHGVGAAGNSGAMNHIDVVGNMVHDCGKFLTTAGSGISFYEFSNVDGGDDGFGYSNYVVSNVVYNCFNDPSTAVGDGNGIVIDDMNCTQGGPGTPYLGTTLVFQNLTVGNGGRGVHAFDSSNVHHLFNTVAQNLQLITDTNAAELSAIGVLSTPTGLVIKYNVTDPNLDGGRVKWLDDYGATQTTDANVFLNGNDQGTNSIDRSGESLDYFRDPNLFPSNASEVVGWRPAAGAETVVIGGTLYSSLSRWADFFGFYRPAREAGWSQGFTEGPASGSSMPVGGLPGWTQIFAEDFSTDSTIGTWGPGDATTPAAYNGKFRLYPDGTPDTNAQIAGSDSGYYPSSVLDTAGSVLRWHVHRDGTTAKAAAVLPVFGASGNQTYGRYQFRMRADVVTGFKVAWLLWPQSENWPTDGEIDFPEGALGMDVSAFMHRQSGTDGSDQDYFPGGVTMSDWHTYTIEWLAGSCKFFVDDTLVGNSTSRVPNTPMHFILQTERQIGGSGPGPSDAGLVELDWIVIYSPA